MPRPLTATTSRRVLLATAAGAFACQAPFGSDRHDVETDRIVAITTADGDLRPVLALDGRLGRNADASFTWYLLTDGAPIPPADAGVTPWSTEPTVAASPGTYGLRVTFPSGTVREAVLTLQTTSGPVTGGIALEQVGLPFAPMDDEEALTAAARAGATPSALSGAAPPGTWVRARADVVPEATDRVRWMQQGPADAVGVTFLELDATTTDIALGALVLDDLAIDESIPADPGVRTLLALVLGPLGAHSLVARDLEVGAGDGTWVRWSDALLPADVRATSAGTATLRADDATPLGLRAEAVEIGVDEVPEAPPCAGNARPLTALLDGRCSAADLDGTVVAVEAP